MKKSFSIFSVVIALILAACEHTKSEPSQTSSSPTTEPVIIAGELSGSFSISPSTKVHFSQGNLQYNATTDTWRFAEHQYKLIQPISMFPVDSIDSLWTDVFGWGTGDAPTKPFNDMVDYSVYHEWGDNAINNGGNKSNTWRTLTRDEWVYLFEKRPNADNLYETTFNIHNMTGVVIFPDNWVMPQGVIGSNIKNGVDISPYIYYTDAEWDIMEAHGAVFLPAAALYNDHGEYLGGFCRYWSSTPYNEYCAYYKDFYNYSSTGGDFVEDADGMSYCLRAYHLFVRLVR